jgi:poly-gamma-glutamate capsule biosynthesis protein CapA/YwtB (metallophosphatase superfamily)
MGRSSTWWRQRTVDGHHHQRGLKGTITMRDAASLGHRVTLGLVLAGWLTSSCATPTPEAAPKLAEACTTQAAGVGRATGTPIAGTPIAEAPPPKDQHTITISAVGDCAIGDLHHGAGAPGSFAAQLAAVDDPLSYPFSAVAETLQADDLTIANLEGTLTTHKAWQNPVFSIRGKPEYAQMLKRGGVDLVDLDNNHSHDYGVQGHEDTKLALTNADVAYFGRGTVDRRTIKGVEVVNLGYLGGPAGTRKQVVADVARESQTAAIVIVSFHWGVEGFYATHPDQRSLGRAAIDAGATLVLGHHPHVLQGIETYKGRRIVYSLGNFVFGANSQPQDMDSIIYQERFEVAEGKVESRGQRIIPVRISSDKTRNDFRPVILEPEEAQVVLRKLQKLSDV